MEYLIETANETNELIAVVNELIRQGWKPLGGIAVSQSSYQYDNFQGTHNGFVIEYAQALVRCPP